MKGAYCIAYRQRIQMAKFGMKFMKSVIAYNSRILASTLRNICIRL